MDDDADSYRRVAINLLHQLRNVMNKPCSQGADEQTVDELKKDWDDGIRNKWWEKI